MSSFRSTAVIASACVASMAAAQPTCHQLADTSTYTAACQTDTVAGTFRLEETNNFGTVLEYAVTDLHLVVPGHTVDGHGTYTRISGFAGWDHELELMLSVDGLPPVAFTSGVVPGGGSFPSVAITVSAGQPLCSDVVIDVRAEPGDCACPCELTGDNVVDVFDLLAYLDLWFATDPAAELDGTAGVDVFDLLAYLDCWFAGCG